MMLKKVIYINNDSVSKSKTVGIRNDCWHCVRIVCHWWRQRDTSIIWHVLILDFYWFIMMPIVLLHYLLSGHNGLLIIDANPPKIRLSLNRFSHILPQTEMRMNVVVSVGWDLDSIWTRPETGSKWQFQHPHHLVQYKESHCWNGPKSHQILPLSVWRLLYVLVSIGQDLDSIWTQPEMGNKGQFQHPHCLIQNEESHCWNGPKSHQILPSSVVKVGKRYGERCTRFRFDLDATWNG